MNTDLMFSSATYLWSTPQGFFDALDREFHFTIDVCADDSNHKCFAYYTEKDDGLSQKWEGVCYMNPPYGREIRKWVIKAWRSAMSGATVVCLLPSRTDTKWFSYIWNHKAHRPRKWAQVRFIKGRLKFGNSKDAAPFPIVVVVFSNNSQVVT